MGVTWKFEMPPTSKVRPIFHFSQLKDAIRNYTPEAKLPTDLEVELDGTIEYEKVSASMEIVKAPRSNSI